MFEAMQRRRRLMTCVLAFILAALILAAIIYTAYYNARFFPGTFIEGIDCSGLLPREAEALLENELMTRPVQVLSEDGQLLLGFSLGELYDDSLPLSAALEDILLRQREGAFLGVFPTAGGEHRLNWLDEERILPVLERTDDYGHALAVNSFITETEDGWVITASSDGSVPDHGGCAAQLARLLDSAPVGGEEGELQVVLRELPVAPRVGEGDAALARQLDIINSALDIRVTVDFGSGLDYTFSYDEVRQLYDVTLTDEGAVVTYLPHRLRPLVDGVIDAVGGDGAARKYGVIQRDEHYWDEAWDDGFILNRQRLYAGLNALFAAGKSGTVTAEYDYTSALMAHYGEEVPEGTYIEISIANQYMWYYVDGQLLVETPVVTGCEANGDGTNKGVFIVKYLDEGAYLSGGSSNRGPGYHVDYWIPFDGNIGLHDAQWVTEFGGDIYLENGSHGCVNTPLEAMKTIYMNCERFCTVVVH